MNTTPSIALSGMNVAQTRLSNAAHNIANQNTKGFRRSEVSAQAQNGGGVTAQVTPAATPGASLVQDVVEQKMAVLEFKASAQVLKTSNQLLGSLLNDKA